MYWTGFDYIQRSSVQTSVVVDCVRVWWILMIIIIHNDETCDSDYDDLIVAK